MGKVVPQMKWISAKLDLNCRSWRMAATWHLVGSCRGEVYANNHRLCGVAVE